MDRPVLVLVEGANDAQFLIHISNKLHTENTDLPDLAEWQQAGVVLLVPLGGGDPLTWPDRLRPLGLPEFHLYDREQWPETGIRLRAAKLVNERAGCQAAVTSKRTLENYLHPQAIVEAGGPLLHFGDEDSVSMLLARRQFENSCPTRLWDGLPRRSRCRLAARTKRWLNQAAAGHMSVGLLAERDPAGELLGWLRAIDSLRTRHGDRHCRSDRPSRSASREPFTSPTTPYNLCASLID